MAGRNHTYIPSPQLSISCMPWTEFMGGLVSVLVPYSGSEVPSVTASVTGPITQGNFAVTSSPSHLVLTWGDGTTDKVTWMPALDSMLTQG